MRKEIKANVLKDIYDFIMRNNNKVHVRDMQRYIRELANRYGIGVSTVYKYIQDTDWIHRSGYPLSNAYYFIANSEIVEPFRRYTLDFFKYIDTIKDENNRNALMNTVDTMVRYDYEPTGGYDTTKESLVMLLEAFGFKRNGESDRQLYKYIIVTYHLLIEYVNAIDYLIEDLYTEPIDIEFELELIRGDVL